MNPEDLRKSIESALGRADRLKVFGLIQRHFQNFRDELRQFEARQPDAEAPPEPAAEAPIEPEADTAPPAPADANPDDGPAPEPERPSEGRGRDAKKRKPLYAGGTTQDLQQAMRLNVIFSPPIALNKRSRHRDWDKS